VYKYQALNNQGEYVEGEFNLTSEDLVIDELLKLDYVPITVSPIKNKQTRGFRFRQRKHFELQTFYENLHDYLDSGLSIDKALELEATAQGQSASGGFLNQLVDQVRQGVNLSEAMKNHPDTFSDLHAGIVKVGEETDSLPESFRLLSTLLQDLNEFKQKIKSALAYPVILSAVLLISILVLFGMVIPRFETLFLSMGIEMDGITGIIVGISKLLTQHYEFLLFGLLAIILLLRALIIHIGNDDTMSRRLLRFPLLGRILRHYNLYIFSMVMSILLKKNITVIRSLEYVRNAINNRVYKNEIKNMVRAIGEGEMVNKVFIKDLFGQHFTYIVGVGEETGNLSQSFTKLARFYYKQLDSSIKTLMLYVEPVIIMLLGLIVGFIVVTMLQAILSINELVI
jgi:type II secretory pathway component PulF